MIPENSVLPSDGFLGMAGKILPAFLRKSWNDSAPLSFQIAVNSKPQPENKKNH